MRTRFQESVSWFMSAYCWAGLAGNTAFWFLGAMLLQVARGAGVWNTLLQRWAKVNTKGGGFDCRVEGLEHVSCPAVVVANHRSIFDISLIAATVPPPVFFVAREDLLRVPIVGAVLRRGRHILVPRHGTSGMHHLVRQVMDRIEGGGRVVIFAEGTRGSTDGVLPFGAGAFRMARLARCALVPAAIVGTDRAIGKGSRLIRPSRVAISFLEPRLVSAQAARSSEFRESVRVSVEQVVGGLQSWCDESLTSKLSHLQHQRHHDGVSSYLYNGTSTSRTQKNGLG